MVEPTAEELALARKMVKRTLSPSRHTRCNCRAEIDAGEWDNGHKVRIALAAIRETTELSAKLVDDLNKHGPYMAIGAAKSLRSYAHLKDTSHG